MTKKSDAKVPVDEEWRVESDMRTLMEADAIKADPKRYAKVQSLAKRKMMEVAKIAADKDTD